MIFPKIFHTGSNFIKLQWIPVGRTIYAFICSIRQVFVRVCGQYSSFKDNKHHIMSYKSLFRFNSFVWNLFLKTLELFKVELLDDSFVRSHLDTLYDNLLEQNLSRIIEPFSKVQIEHIASLIKLPRDTVERKLSQMILDKKLSGKMHPSFLRIFCVSFNKLEIFYILST